jgi:hypothetical protein
MKAVSGAEEIHNSTWPYFSALHFIVPSLTTKESASNLVSDTNKMNCPQGIIFT